MFSFVPDRRLGRTVPATPSVVVSKICTSSASLRSPSMVASPLTVPLMVRFSIAVTFSPSGVTSMRTIQPAG